MAAISGFPMKDALDYAFPAPDGTPPAGVTRWNNPTFAYRSLFALRRMASPSEPLRT
jgi:hypothetical protein